MKLPKFYHELRKKVETEHSRIYTKVKKLATDVGSKEEMPLVIHGRQTRSNPVLMTTGERL